MNTRFASVLALSLFVFACSGDDEPMDASDVGAIAPDQGSDMVDAGIETDAGEDMGSAEPTDKLFTQGPHAVGYTEFEVTYTPPGAAEPRVIPVKGWYPAVAGDAELTTYKVAGIVEVTSENALDEPVGADGEFPILVYSHGSGGEGLLAYPYAEHFASWGWVVVSPNHVGNTALDGVRGEFAPFAQTALYRVTDISALLDAVESDAVAAPMMGLADMENVLLFGHSFGGYTALAVGGADVDFDLFAANCPSANDDGSCEFIADADVEAAFRAGFGDPRVDAIVPQAPALVQGFVAGGLASIEVPTMIQSGDRDRSTPNATEAQPAWEATDGASDVWIRLPDGAHFTFISICYDLTQMVLDLFRPDAPMDGCGDDFIAPELAVPVLNAYLRAFAETHVLGSTEWTEVLDGTVVFDEGFNVTTR